MAEPTFPQIYERLIAGSLFKPFARELLDRVGLSSGERLLDLCCGTGIVSREALPRVGEANVVGADIDPEMLDVARSLVPGMEWHEADAQALPFEDGAFDVVVCQQGLQFVPDKAKAVGEMRRVLKPGGRAGIATWRPLEENALFFELEQIGHERLGPFEDRRHSFGDAAAIEALLREAGFDEVSSQVVSRRVTVPEGRMFVRLNAMALASMAGVEPERRKEVAGQIAEESEAVFLRYAEGEAVVFDVGTNVVTGRG